MRSSKLTLNLCFLLLLASGCSSISKIHGSYDGNTVSSRRYSPSETTFFPLPNGEIAGTYWLKDDKLEYGQLRSCTPIQNQTIICEWRDRFGSGKFQATFSDDYMQFNGFWGDSEKVYSGHRWDGKKSSNK